MSKRTPYETYLSVIDGQVVLVKKYKVVADLEPAGRMVRPKSWRLRMGVTTQARLGLRGPGCNGQAVRR